jgi:lysophospholipase L1-like esterase
VALGDSYTIGTGLDDEAQNFPTILDTRITEETGIPVAVTNLGVNGYTTTDLIRHELPVARGLHPELATILIGANDIVQGSDDAAYRTRLAEIYDALVGLRLPATRILAVSTPDFSGLPGARPFGTARDLRARIDAFNGVALDEASARGFHYADISGITRQSNGIDWLAADELHPGPAQHRAIADQLWALIGPSMKKE